MKIIHQTTDAQLEALKNHEAVYYYEELDKYGIMNIVNGIEERLYGVNKLLLKKKWDVDCYIAQYNKEKILLFIVNNKTFPFQEVGEIIEVS